MGHNALVVIDEHDSPHDHVHNSHANEFDCVHTDADAHNHNTAHKHCKGLAPDNYDRTHHDHSHTCTHDVDHDNGHNGHTHEQKHEHSTTGGHTHSHGHDHDCGHDHGNGVWAYLPHSHGLHERIAADRRSLRRACLILFLSLSVQVAGGMLVNSSVLEAEAVHTALDGLVLVISLLSIALAERPAAPRYTYGYGRAEVLSALVSVLALALMCAQLFAGAVRNLVKHAAGGPAATVRRGQAVMFAEAFTLVNNLLITAVLARSSASLNIRALRAHVIGDSIGNVVVLVAGAVMWAHPSAAILDPLLTIVVVLAIAAMNVGLGRETLEVLMQAAPAGLDPPSVAKKVRALPSIRAVRDIHVWTLTSGVIVGSLKVEVDEALQDRTDFERVESDVEVLLQGIGIHQTTVQVRTYMPHDNDKDALGGVPKDVVQRVEGDAKYQLLGDDEEV